MIAVVVALVLNTAGMLLVLALGRVYVARRLRAERATNAARDRATWRRVDPMLVGAAEGSLAHIAGVVLQHTPLALHTQFRTREVNDLNIGTVRVSFEVGTRYHKTEES